MSAKKAIAVNTSVQLLGKAINISSSLIITFLIGRYLGETFYGNFTKVFATATLLYMGLDFGLNATVVKSITVNPEKEAYFFSTLFGLRLFAALSLYIILLAGLFIIPTTAVNGYTLEVKIAISVFALQYFSQSALLSSNSVFQKHLRYSNSVLATSLGSIIQTFLVYYLIVAQATLLTISIAYLLGSLVTASTALWLVKRTLQKVAPIFNLSQSKKLIKKTLPIGLALVFNLLATKTDTILLTVFRPTAEVGFYGLARRIFDVALVFPTFFMNSSYPVMLQKFSKRIFFRSLKFLLTVSLFGSIFLISVSPYITLLRPQFSPTIPILRTLSFFLPVYFLTGLLLWTIIAAGLQKKLIKIYFIAFMFNLFTNLIFIPKYGPPAAALTFVSTELVVLTLLTKPLLRKFYDSKNLL